MVERSNKIELDIDKDRIREIVAEALRMISEYSGGVFKTSIEHIMSDLEAQLISNNISTIFYLSVPLDKIPDLLLRVDPRRKKLLCKSSFRKKTIKLNHFVTIL